MTENQYLPPPPARHRPASDLVAAVPLIGGMMLFISLAYHFQQSSRIETLGRLLNEERDARLDAEKRLEKYVADQTARHAAQRDRRMKERLALMPAGNVEQGVDLAIVTEADEENRVMGEVDDGPVDAEPEEPEQLPDEVLHADDPERLKPGFQRDKRPLAQRDVRAKPLPRNQRPKDQNPIDRRMPGVGPRPK